MDKQNKNINEDDKFKIHVDTKTLEDPSKTKKLVSLGKRNPNIEFDLEHPAISKGGSSSSSNSSSMSSMMEQSEAIIQPQDKATIKYLSNVKDEKTGEVSKPFTIGTKNYQMVRGITPEKSIVVGVYCYDDMDENGENIIHPMEYFKENIANPMKENMGMVGQDIQISDGYDHAEAERDYHDKESFIDYLNLSDIEPFYKHFFVNIENGEVIAKFKNMREMIKSGIKLGPKEDYMDVKALKRFRFGDYFNKDINENELPPEDAGTDVPKLQSDVKKLANLIKNKFSTYLSKLDKPIEQVQFLTAMAKEIGVPLNKLSSIINTYKDIAKQGDAPEPAVNEKKIMTKKALEESIKNKDVITIVKVKNIFNGQV